HVCEPLQPRRFLPADLEMAVLIPAIETVERAVAEKAAAVAHVELRVLPLVVQIDGWEERRDVVVVHAFSGATAEEADVVVERFRDADRRRQRPSGAKVL